MKYLINALLIFYVVLKPLVPLLDYALRYDYISTKLCVNQSKVELNCNGKCYVTKELAKSSGNPFHSSEQTKSLTFLETFIVYDVLTIILNENKKEHKTIEDHYANHYFYTLTHTIFHPPIV